MSSDVFCRSFSICSIEPLYLHFLPDLSMCILLFRIISHFSVANKTMESINTKLIIYLPKPVLHVVESGFGRKFYNRFCNLFQPLLEQVLEASWCIHVVNCSRWFDQIWLLNTFFSSLLAFAKDYILFNSIPSRNSWPYFFYYPPHS